MAERSRGRRAVRASIVVLLAVALGQPATVAVAAGTPGTATLVADPTSTIAGDPVELSGSVATEPPCAAGRPVLLESQTTGPGWSIVGEGSTDSAGAFSLRVAPLTTAMYRASLPSTVLGETTCQAVVSPELTVGAAARVEATAPGSVRAGACPRIEATVSPPKPGSDVELERLRGDRWRPMAAATLNGTSTATFLPCTAFDDIGSMALRVTWPGEDEANAAGASPPIPFEVLPARWMTRIDELVEGRSMSVALAEAGAFLYRHADRVRRAPASNEKLLLSMALLDALGPEHRIATVAAAEKVTDDAVRGDLWIEGRGDPEVGRARLAALAERIADAGIRHVGGSVNGSTGFFGRDWWARGWRSYFPPDEVALPTALTFDGNQVRGTHIRDPELRAATFLTSRLEDLGVRVRGRPGAGRPPAGLQPIAEAVSRPLVLVIARMNRHSLNFSAEVLGKLLGAKVVGRPGTIAKGASAIEAWAAARGTRVTAFDASGLSYDDRVTVGGLVRLLGEAEAEPWGGALRDGLPGPGQGTLERRLEGVPVRAKTGTLDGISALTGWVWLERADAWAEFSILSRGMPKTEAMRVEDAIVRAMAANAR